MAGLLDTSYILQHLYSFISTALRFLSKAHTHISSDRTDRSVMHLASVGDNIKVNSNVSLQNQLGKWWHMTSTVVVVAVTTLGIILFAPHLLLLLLFALFVCNLLVPVMYISLQSYKQYVNVLNGTDILRWVAAYHVVMNHCHEHHL